MQRISISLLFLFLVAGAICAGSEKTAVPVHTVSQYAVGPDCRVIEPEDDFQLEKSTLMDMLPALSQAAPVERTAYTLLENTSCELYVTHIRGAEKGPVFYVVAGLHGDERAGWYAAALLQDAVINVGDLYVLAKANPWGVEHEQRTTKQNLDINRRFPGSPDGTDAEQIADAIFRDIHRVQPELVLDLHEACIIQEGRDFLGNSLILGQIQGIENLLLDFWDASGQCGLQDVPFSFYSGAPEGSLNAVIGTELQIPVISVETFRGDLLSQRVQIQLQVILYMLNHEQLLSP